MVQRTTYRLLATAAAAGLLCVSTFPAHATPSIENRTPEHCHEELVTTPAESNADASDTPSSSQELPGTALEDGSVVYTGEEAQLTITPPENAELDQQPDAGLYQTIGCDLNVQNVHPSSHIPGTINGVSTIQCTGNAGSLTLHYSLIRVSPNNQQWGAPTVTNTGESFIQTNRAVHCSEGPANFQGWAQGEISPPAGYELVGPPIHDDWGNTTYVDCNASAGSAEGAGELTERIRVTFVRADVVE